MKQIIIYLLFIIFCASVYATDLAMRFPSGTPVTVPSMSGGQYYAPQTSDTTVAGSVTADCNVSLNHYIQLGNGANTINLTHPQGGAKYWLILKQPAGGAAGTVTFNPTLYWRGGSAPTLTATNGARDDVFADYDGVESKFHADVALDIK